MASQAYTTLHVADIHMSNSLPYAKHLRDGVTDRLSEQEELIYRIFGSAKKYKCKAIIIHGDLFDRSRVDAITLTTTVKSLAKTPVPIIIVPGNHDGINTRGERFTVEALSEIPNLTCAETGRPIKIKKWLYFWPLEFAPLERTREEIKRMKLPKGAVNVLLMHNSVQGCIHVGWKCEKGLGLSPKEVTSRFDHVLAGHFHDPQTFGKNGRYLGAPMHHRFDDIGRDAGFWIMKWNPDGSRKETFVSGNAPRFYVADFDDKEERKRLLNKSTIGRDTIRKGDFVRVNTRCTHAIFRKRRRSIDEYVSKLKKNGVRASWFHDPVYHHVRRIPDGKDEEGLGVIPVRRMVPSYVDTVEVDTSGFDIKELKRVGLEIFREVKSRWSDVGSGNSSARLLSVEAENFAGFVHFRLQLSDQGLTFIGGENRDSSAATSNGACKSGIFKAISWCLYDKSVDNQIGDKVIHKGTKKARVVIELQVDGDIYKVIRERHKQSPKLFLERNGSPVSLSKADIQSHIDKIIGVDWEGFKNTTLYGQGDRDRFVYPTTKDSKRKSILHHMLRTNIFELCFEVAKKMRLEVSKERLEISKDVHRYTERIKDHDLSNVKRRVDEYEKERNSEIRELLSHAKKLERKAKKASESINVKRLQDKVSRCEKRISVLSVRIAKKERELKRISGLLVEKGERMATAVASLKGVASSIELLKSDKCPTCSTPLSEKAPKDHKSALLAKAARLSKRIQLLREARETADLAKDKVESDLLRLKGSLSNTEAVYDKVRSAESSARSVKSQISLYRREAKDRRKQAKVLKGKENPHIEALSQAEEKVRKLKRLRKASKGKLSEVERQLSNLEFWVRGFGPQGIPSFALDAVMPFITDRANHYLKILSDGDMSIKFTTQRKLKSSSEHRDEIGITWFIEGIENYPPSGGQWKKMEIATSFALMDLVSSREGSHVNILCLDECLDGLDSEGRQRVISMLHGVRSDRESIFVISHEPDLAEIFERTATVIKEDGVSRLEMAA